MACEVGREQIQRALVTPEDQVGGERGESFKCGDSPTRVCVKCLPVPAGSSPTPSLCACCSACPVSTRVLSTPRQGLHASWPPVFSWSHVFLLLTLNIYSTADRHWVSFYNLLVVTE